MKWIFVLITFFIFFFELNFADASHLKVLTYNIRYFNWGDGQNAWPLRKHNLLHFVKTINPDLIGMQEVLYSQLGDIKNSLGDNYKKIGVGRDDGEKGGEFNPIFYRDDLFVLIDSGTFWLAPDPSKPSGAVWDAACPRIVTYGYFMEISSGKEFLYLNTHFDHRGINAQLNSVDVLNEEMKLMNLPENVPVILTGDFNLQERSSPYKKITQFFFDARYLSKTPHKGPTASYVGDKNWTTLSPPESRIDYLFVKNIATVFSHEIVDEKFDGHYPSDHLPLKAELEI